MSGIDLSIEDVRQFLFREARYLDDREWDRWLELYAPDAEFWMPAWDDDDGLTRDPQREISLIYYSRRDGLNDRVYRIRTERSGATSLPEPRTSHNINNVEIIGAGWGAYVMGKPDVNREIGAEIERLIGTGHVRPIVGARFPLERAADALRLLDGRGATGKVVLEL